MQLSQVPFNVEWMFEIAFTYDPNPRKNNLEKAELTIAKIWDNRAPRIGLRVIPP